LELLDFDEYALALAACGLAFSATELQGGLFGRLAGGHTLAENELLAFTAELVEVSPLSLTPAKETLERIYQDTLAQAQDQQGLLELLLPDDDELLPERLDALSKWCRCYLSGLGQTGLSGDTALPADAAEAMRDVAAIALVDPECQEDEDDEASYVELVEFVRVATTLIQVELTQLLTAPAKSKH